MAPPKQKGQKMGLGEFLTDSSLGSWADEMEDAPLPSNRYGSSSYGRDSSYQSSGATSSYADRGYAVREALPLPSRPPYTVHLGNMSFDATEGDIQDFFAGCEVTSVRIVEDKIDRKPKGFGYVEFGTVEGLKKALEANGTQFQGRNIRVSVAEPQKDRGEAREISDWTRKGPLPDLGGARRDSGRGGFERGGGGGFERGGGGGFERGGGGGFERGGGGGFERGGFDRGPPRNFDDQAGDRSGGRQPFEQGDGKVRDFSNWERKGPLQPTAPTGPPAGRPSSNDGPRERRNSPSWGDGRSNDGSRPPRRDFADRPPPVERTPTAAEQDSQWRTKMRPDPPAVQPASPNPSNREPSVPSSPAAPAHAPLTSRPKLNLQKRTVSTAESSPTTAAATTPGDTRASPFGAARPIDTYAREKEIEEKLRARKEQEAKEREDKRAADDKAKEDRRLAKDAEKTKTKANGQAAASEGGDAAEAPAGKNIQILRRDGEGTEDAATEGSEAASAAASEPAGTPVAAPDAKAPNGDAEAPDTPVEDDGWNTVTKPQKNRKR